MLAPKTKIDLAVADTRDSRTQLHSPHLDTAAGKLVATDGMILAALTVQIEELDTSGPIPRSALTLARKHLPKSKTFSLEATKTNIKLPDGTVLPRPSSDNPFPSYWAEKIPLEATGGPDLRVDAALLYRLAQALHDEKNKVLGVGLTFSRDMKGEIDYQNAVRVTVGQGSDRVGVLMPIRKSGAK